MRYPAAEKLEIIRLVEQSRLPVRRTLDKLGILPARFYRWRPLPERRVRGAERQTTQAEAGLEPYPGSRPAIRAAARRAPPPGHPRGRPIS